MAKSELPKASKETLKNYKTILNDYYQNIKDEKDSNNLHEKTLTFLKTINKAVKETKGIGKVKTKINWEKVHKDMLSYADSLWNSLSIKGNANHNQKLATITGTIDYIDLLTQYEAKLKSENIQELKDLLKTFSDNANKKFLTDLHLKNFTNFMESNGDKLKDSAQSLSQELSIKIQYMKKEVEKQFDELTIVQEEKNKRSQSTTLVAIKTAQNQTTVKNVMNVISLVGKHHPIALGATAIKINNCLKKKKF